MKKHFKVLHWIDTGIFPGTIMFSCGFSYDEIVALLKKKNGKEWLQAISEDEHTIKDATAGLALKRVVEDLKTGKLVTYFFIIFRESFTFTDYEYCKLAHEVLHICQYHLKDILDRDKEHEAEAYLHTHVMKNCLQALRNKLP